jgi:hypothetical protein
VKDVIWGDQNEDGNSKDTFRIKSNRPSQTQALRAVDDYDDHKYAYQKIEVTFSK